MVLSKKKKVKSLIIQWHYLIFFVRKSHLWSNKRSGVLSIFAYTKCLFVPVCFHILSLKSAFWKKSGLKLRLVKLKTQLFDESCVLGIGQKRELNVEILCPFFSTFWAQKALFEKSQM